MDIPRGQGFLVVSAECCDYRRDAEEVEKFEAKLKGDLEAGRISLQRAKIAPMLVCEKGAEALRIDRAVARAAAERWWATGQIAFAPTPIVDAPASPIERTFDLPKERASVSLAFAIMAVVGVTTVAGFGGGEIGQVAAFYAARIAIKEAPGSTQYVAALAAIRESREMTQFAGGLTAAVITASLLSFRLRKAAIISGTIAGLSAAVTVGLLVGLNL